MHIILVSDRMATARSITLTRRHLAFAVTALMMAILTLSSMFSYLTVRHAADLRLPFLQDMLRNISLEEASRTRDALRDSVTHMAARLGQLQGQLMQLDTLGERLAGLAGAKLKDARAKPAATAPENAGRGGPLVRPEPVSDLPALQQALDELARQVDSRSQTFARLEDRLLDERLRQNLLPSALPVVGGSRSSGFGWRSDPFTGQSSLHEGLDFAAESGTPILASAAGIVQRVERHPDYGMMVDVDHGGGLMTRYAHATLALVAEGEIVKRGQQIATVGATGRATGPHLHYEVRLNGVPQNPARFLDAKEPVPLARR